MGSGRTGSNHPRQPTERETHLGRVAATVPSHKSSGHHALDIMPTAEKRVRLRAAAEAAHRRPEGRAPRGYLNWDADTGVWRNDNGAPQPTTTAAERRKQKSEARQRQRAAEKAKKATERAERERRGERARDGDREGEAVQQADDGAG